MVTARNSPAGPGLGVGEALGVVGWGGTRPCPGPPAPRPSSSWSVATEAPRLPTSPGRAEADRAWTQFIPSARVCVFILRH